MFLTSLNFCCYYSEEWIYMNLRCLWSLCLLIHTQNKWDSGWRCSLLVRLLSSTAAAAAKSLQSCLTLCDPIDGSPPGSPVPGILQARTMEWVATFFSNARKWKVKVNLFSRLQLLATPWTTGYQAPPSMGFSSKSTGVGCHCLLCVTH